MDGRTVDGETRVREGGLKWTKQASWKSMEAGRDCLRFPRCRLLARFFPQRMKFNYGETRVYRAYPLVSLFCPPLSRFCLSPFFILLFIIFLFFFSAKFFGKLLCLPASNDPFGHRLTGACCCCCCCFL